jgi:hypothetical protein
MNQINEVRQSHSKLNKTVNGRIAVIVKTYLTDTKSYFGVQYWTPGMIAKAFSVNDDKTISIFKDKL